MFLKPWKEATFSHAEFSQPLSILSITQTFLRYLRYVTFVPSGFQFSHSFYLSKHHPHRGQSCLKKFLFIVRFPGHRGTIVESFTGCISNFARIRYKVDFLMLRSFNLISYFCSQWYKSWWQWHRRYIF